jgi:UDP-N-acetyl-D-galactosamine dehydrogenase
MGNIVAYRFMKKMKSKSISIENSRILIMGLTFKENCPDLRNAGILNVIENLKKKKCILEFYEPLGIFK